MNFACNHPITVHIPLLPFSQRLFEAKNGTAKRNSTTIKSSPLPLGVLKEATSSTLQYWSTRKRRMHGAKKNSQAGPIISWSIHQSIDRKCSNITFLLMMCFPKPKYIFSGLNLCYSVDLSPKTGHDIQLGAKNMASFAFVIWFLSCICFSKGPNPQCKQWNR